MRRKSEMLRWKLMIATVLLTGSHWAAAAEQSAETKALDSTATQWSFQFAYQTMPDYHDDDVNGEPRPEGFDDFLQARFVMPFVFDSFTLLPRLTIRHYENSLGESGIGNTELFGLIIPKPWDWGSGPSCSDWPRSAARCSRPWRAGCSSRRLCSPPPTRSSHRDS